MRNELVNYLREEAAHPTYFITDERWKNIYAAVQYLKNKSNYTLVHNEHSKVLWQLNDSRKDTVLAVLSESRF